MKVIFLDIDGVLNSNDWYVKTRGVGGYNGGDVDPECIELINDLIDATLCLNTTGRPYYGEGAAEGMLNDIAVEGICNLVKSLYEKRTIFIITGREGTPEIIEATKKWLDSNSIKVDGLFFRPVKDYSPGAECKKKIYEDNIKGKYNVEFVLDDNYKCVEMWREQGLVCLQPNEGKF